MIVYTEDGKIIDVSSSEDSYSEFLRSCAPKCRIEIIEDDEDYNGRYRQKNKTLANYLTCDKELKNRYEVYVKNNCLYSNNKLLDTERIFKDAFKETIEDFVERTKDQKFYKETRQSRLSCIVIDKEDKMYVFPFKFGVCYHNFITNKEDLKFAGMGIFKNGKISYITNYNSNFYTMQAITIKNCLFEKLNKMTKNNPQKLFDKNFKIKQIDVVEAINSKKYGITLFEQNLSESKTAEKDYIINYLKNLFNKAKSRSLF